MGFRSHLVFDSSTTVPLRHGWRRWVGLLVGLTAAVADFLIVQWSDGTAIRFVVPGMAAVIILTLTRGDRRPVGGVARPQPSWPFWAWLFAVTAIAVGLMVFADLGYYRYVAREAPPYMVNWDFLGESLLSACVLYPVLEELTYRMALTGPVAAAMGNWPAILVSGAVFAALHFVYGNPGPDNFTAGYFLAWAYLRSGAIWVPIALHSLGNFLIVLGQLAAWEVWYG